MKTNKQRKTNKTKEKNKIEKTFKTNKKDKPCEVIIISNYPPPYGGITVHVKRLFHSLLENNFNVKVMDTSGVLKDIENVTCITGNKIKKYFTLLLKLHYHRKDILHFHVSEMGNFIYLGFILILLSSNSLITIHSGFFDKKYYKLNIIKKMIIRCILKKMKHIITVSDEQKNFINTILKIKTKISVIPAFIVPKEEKGIIKEEIKKLVKTDKKLVLASGYLMPVYGYEYILEAVKRMIKEKKECVENMLLILIFYTRIDIEYKKKITNMIDDLNKKNSTNNCDVESIKIKVYYDLSSTEFIYLIQNSDIYLRATNSDGDCVVIREAMHFNKKVIASDCIKRPNGVIIFKAQDSLDLALKLENTLEDDKIVKYDDTEDNSLKIMKIYNDLIKKR